ncbi:MAG TPA: uracil-DNA glycosylase [Rhodocyclaceae bacterium]|nr:uracil-DNA glycosylase [Rhodocyclaceae bacterium]
MNLTREQMLAEMGISPIWKLRNPGPASAQDAPMAPETVDLPPAAADVPELPVSVPTPGTKPVANPGQGSRAEVATRLDWDGLRESTANCRACGLCEQRKQAVLGVGDVEADWLFIGEGPGAEEDIQGEPFVGQAGKLLDNMLAAIDLKRGANAYIANAVKCRPPGNRTPSAEEMAACRPYLERQIELIKPRVIVLLGRAAVNTILQNEQSLAALRGKRFDYQGIPVIVTYHPAYLLRNLPEKAKAWEDLVLARRLMRDMPRETG